MARGATFKIYIHSELDCFLEWMSTCMKKQFNFVNIPCNAFNAITEELMDLEYKVNVSAAAAAAAA